MMGLCIFPKTLVILGQKYPHLWPQSMWVSRIQASAFEEGRVYVTLNGYRYDNFEPMVYVSENYGNTWRKIGLNLPKEPVNVVKEDPKKQKPTICRH